MNKDNDSKRLVLLLVLFFIFVILTGIFVGKRLVEVVRAAVRPDSNQEYQNRLMEAEFSGAATVAVEEKGGYPWPSYTPFRTSTNTKTPTETPKIPFADTPTPTATFTPTSTNTSTFTPTNTPTKTSTPPIPPTVGPGGGGPTSFAAVGLLFSLIGLLGFSLYYFSFIKSKRS